MINELPDLKKEPINIRNQDGTYYSTERLHDYQIMFNPRSLEIRLIGTLKEGIDRRVKAKIDFPTLREAWEKTHKE
jgi:hypothetical protein